MTTHLSARLTWHDTGWDGRVCRDPTANVFCTAHEHIRDQKRTDVEAGLAGTPLWEIDFRPPCSRDPGAFSPEPYAIQHADPLTWRNLGIVNEELPAHSFSASPYGHMFGESGGWEYDRDKQLEQLGSFFGALERNKSLVFFYLKDAQPFLETSDRIICGISRIADIGPQRFFPGTYDGKTGYPVWARAITHDAAVGFRLPLQEYWTAKRDVREGLCVIPRGATSSFSFVGEHVTDDIAVTVIERLIEAARWHKADGFVPAAWDARIAWLEGALAGVWTTRGAWPGLAPVLTYLECASGPSLARELASRGSAAGWPEVERILNGLSEAPTDHVAGLAKASAKWRALPESRRELLRLLARFELTADQVERVATPELRQPAGLPATDDPILANPYLLAELDTGTGDSEPIAFDTIDHGMMPATAAAVTEPIARQDDRRLRAAANDILEAAASTGDTLLRFGELSQRLASAFPSERQCILDRDLIQARRDFYGELLSLEPPGAIATAALGQLAEDEREIRARLERLVKKSVAAPVVEWRPLLQHALRDASEMTSEDEARARAEKVDALARAICMRLCVITGRAGTGKTTVARALLDGIRSIDGNSSTLLLAPTGKARIRLQEATGREAKTIHQFLAENGWIRFGNAFALNRTGGTVDAADTVLIDEMSMVPTDLLAALFRAIDWNRVRRLVLIGDANQLPPIGPGRPFADVIQWLDEDSERRTHLIRLEHRGRFKDANSIALQLSDGYVAGHAAPGDDEVLAAVARKDLPATSDLEVHFWRDGAELQALLHERISQLALGGADGYKALDASFTRGTAPAPERWQVLSPVRRQHFGTDEINRNVQLRYRKSTIDMAHRRAFIGKLKLARPAGDQQIVWRDKVIQVINQRRWSWSRSDNTNVQRYVANGEVGIVTHATYANKRDTLKVTFGTQPGVLFSYYRGQVNDTLELAYAITVHKSQGSDFETVFLVLPRAAATLSRELIYTALTRFRTRLVLLIEQDVRVLQQYRRPSTSETLNRNTNLFTLRIRPDDAKPYHPENLIHRTTDNDLVRSKSELVVAETLKRLGISYEYEKPLYAKDDPTDFRLPDFTVHYEGDIWYWEHLGMLSVPSYAEAWERKRSWYDRQGLLDRLITSEDGPDGSIDALKIEETARARVLS